ncbi:hypothetical protein ScalyP_jg2495 [Parmales sp. scaly parma]|nr:hypothetical protein ScalyP_jg2495 [Parmales sp. scaly parma]
MLIRHFARRAAPMVQKRTFIGIDAMQKSPSKIAEARAVQNKGGTWLGADGPTYLKQKNDKYWTAAAGGLVAFAGIQLVSGYFHMFHGTNKLE